MWVVGHLSFLGPVFRGWSLLTLQKPESAAGRRLKAVLSKQMFPQRRRGLLFGSSGAQPLSICEAEDMTFEKMKEI